LLKRTPFEQGNKRTAFEAMWHFLRINGFDLDIEDSAEWEEPVISLIEHRSTEEDFCGRSGPSSCRSDDPTALQAACNIPSLPIPCGHGTAQGRFRPLPECAILVLPVRVGGLGSRLRVVPEAAPQGGFRVYEIVTRLLPKRSGLQLRR
jgi:hypothetical protein